MTISGRHTSVGGVRIGFLKLPGVLLLAVAGPGGLSAFAQDAVSSPDWAKRDGAWKSKTLPLGYFFQISVNGRTFIPMQNSSANSPGQTAADDKQQDENEIVAIFDGKPITVRREMRFDPKRQAIRILDVFTNSSEQEREVRVDYNTSLSGGSIRYNGAIFPGGEAREYGNGAPDDAMGAVVLAEKTGSDAVPLFIWGHRDAKWPVSLNDFSSSIRLTYQGTVAKGGKVALLHWVATAGLERGVKLEQTFDRFLKNGRLVDAMVPAEIAPLVMNFKPDAFGKSEEVAPLQSSTARLVALESHLKKFGIKRGGNDLLWLNKQAQLFGEVVAGKISLQSQGAEIQVPFASIAALRGGGGRGREHQLFLRDGSVLTGRVVLTGAKLAGDIGATALDADALEFLLLRPHPEDGRAPKEAQAFAQWQGGGLCWLGKNGAGDVEVFTAFGRVKISAADLWLIERRKEAPFDLAVTLRDGSRFRGVLGDGTLQLDVKPVRPVAAAELARWGVAGALDLSDGEIKVESPRRCKLRDGSVLSGTPAAGEMRVRTVSGENRLKTADIVKLARKQGAEESVELELISGAKLEAQLLDDALRWKFGSQTLELPVSQIAELVLPADPFNAVSSASSKAGAEAVNNHDDPAAPTKSRPPLAAPR